MTEADKNDRFIAMIRVVVKALVPLVVGKLAILPVLASLGLNIDQAMLENALYLVAVGGYSWVVGWLETRVNAKFGLLAGVPRAPKYRAPGFPEGR